MSAAVAPVGAAHPGPAVTLRGVRVELGRRLVLDAIDLGVAPGGWTCLVGPNGAGKSTLLRAVAGLVRATGDVVVNGHDVSSLRPRAKARLAAYAPQEPLLPGDMAVLDYVLVGRTAHLGLLATESADDHAIALEALDALDLSSFVDRRLGELSGGERQRVVLARAIAQQAPLLLLDEPTSALDLGHQQAAFELVDRLRIERGLTVVSAMHDLTLAAQFADTLVLLANGRIVSTGAPADVLTVEAVRSWFGADVEIRRDERGGLVVIPVRRRDEPNPRSRPRRPTARPPTARPPKTCRPKTRVPARACGCRASSS